MAHDDETDAGPYRLPTLLDAARLLNSTLELKELTRIILDIVRAEIHVERISVFVVDRGRGMLQSIVAQGVEGLEISLPIGKGIAGTVAETAEVLDIQDAYADQRFDQSFDQKLGFHTRDLFTLPVYNRQGEIIGVLQLLNRLRPITAADREFLLGISVYIGIALQNAWSHAQVRAQANFDQRLLTLRDHLAETERVSLTSRLFHHVLQEINNPLAVAMGYTELARNHRDLPQELVRDLDKVALGIDKTATAVRAFRQFVEFENKPRTSVSLAAIVREISELRTQEWTAKSINVALVIYDVPNVLADERQIQLAILCLLKNAESSLAGEETGRELRIMLSCPDAGEYVRIDFACSSCLDATRTTPIRQPIATMAASTTGFDLGLASSIIEQHEGRVRRESHENSSTVVVELPVGLNDRPLT